jgi:hypothetical protein
MGMDTRPNEMAPLHIVFMRLLRTVGTSIVPP